MELEGKLTEIDEAIKERVENHIFELKLVSEMISAGKILTQSFPIHL